MIKKSLLILSSLIFSFILIEIFLIIFFPQDLTGSFRTYGKNGLLLNTKNKVDPIVGLFSNFMFSLPFIILFGIFTNSFSATPSLNGVLAAVYVGLFEMGITFVFWLKAMQYTQSTSKIANLIFISPFISLIFIHFIVGEDIYISTLFGLVTIILLLIQWTNLTPNSF